MAEELHVVGLRDDFYRDSFGKVMLIIFGLIVAIGLLAAVSSYLYFSKPSPINFAVTDDWRIQPPVPVDQQYRPDPAVLQWVTNALINAFVFDFYHYNDQLKTASSSFTKDGWKVFLNQLNTYANYNNVQAYKLFVTATPTAAPSIVNSGLLSGRYAWWVQIPLDIKYQGVNPQTTQSITLQVLVVRVPTLDNLAGVAIDNVIVVKNTGSSLLGGQNG